MEIAPFLRGIDQLPTDGRPAPPPAMTAVKQPDFTSVGEYLAGEESCAIKRESPGGTVQAMAVLSLEDLYERVGFAV